MPEQTVSRAEGGERDSNPPHAFACMGFGFRVAGSRSQISGSGVRVWASGVNKPFPPQRVESETAYVEAGREELAAEVTLPNPGIRNPLPETRYPKPESRNPLPEP